MISVVDYGVVNLGSMLNMLKKIGADAQIVSTEDEIARAKKILLPGVGAFDQGMAALTRRQLAQPLIRKAQVEKIPVLGVCLGMQMLGHSSEEGRLPGLGLLDAHTARFKFDAGSRSKVPHMGWGTIQPAKSSRLIKGVDDQSRFYFVHSYHVVCHDSADVLATTEYGYDFVSMIQRGNIFGAQFHPEKSHRFGMSLLRAFAEL
ncbi:imidazole glycerol phosphate synthase subunit HisH [Ramlibacter sp. AW1]|uniref:Imidazole glycerol phosphate synthase subunit HisH n=1 Tax=Ramlibacter aurantiacus TaxID=2801330 RepID=A0A937D2A7_9BURK|nr:imidazole glycerol phosphate synthase subunit HisH [Ramlibacter aurantiacus]MBL0419555.1 imidazole glycerol phosphate synthase subunit HisH [Ramlibacter aurantiacus]